MFGWVGPSRSDRRSARDLETHGPFAEFIVEQLDRGKSAEHVEGVLMIGPLRFLGDCNGGFEQFSSRFDFAQSSQEKGTGTSGLEGDRRTGTECRPGILHQFKGLLAAGGCLSHVGHRGQ